MSTSTTSNGEKKKAKVQITVFANKLKNVAGSIKTSSPFAVVTVLAGSPKEQPKILGKTEVIKHNLSPAWTTMFTTDYTFGKETKINVAVFDENKTDPSKHKPMGSAVFEIGDVLGSNGNVKAKKLKYNGTVFVRVTRAPEEPPDLFHFTLRGIKFKNTDGMFSKSDPFFTIHAQVKSAANSTVWQPVYTSPVIKNDLNPKWPSCQITMDRLCNDNDYNQPILFEFQDWEKSGKHHKLGHFETTVNGMLASVTPSATNVDAKKVDLSKSFSATHKKKTYGKIVVTEAKIIKQEAEKPSMADSNNSNPINNNNNNNNNDGDGFGSVLGTPPNSATSVPNASSAPSAPTTSVFPDVWGVPPATPAQQNNGSGAVPAPFVPTQQDNNSAYQSTLPPAMAPPPRPRFDFTKTVPTFVDYVSGGCEINLSVAIDFTGSNGHPHQPGTLHYIHPDGSMNDYEKAISSIGSIIAKYDSDQKFPCWGFGAKYGGVVQHCFQIGPNAELDGISGVLQAYRQVFATGLIMSGPTVFAEVINYAAMLARSKQESYKQVGRQAYGILLILTDGAVSDINLTKQALSNASDAPLSIVIVGIGQADFSAMQFLDDFQGTRQGGRDICQFVEFQRFKHDKSALTRETLDEIPDQLVQYFYKRHGILPLAPISGSRMNFDDILATETGEDEIDLTMDFGSDGNVKLHDTQQAMYDGQTYGKIDQYLPPPMAPPAPPPNMMQNNQGASTAQLYTGPTAPMASAPPESAPSTMFPQPQHQPFNPANNLKPQQQQQTPGIQPPVVTAAPVPPPPQVFHIQLPANAYPGMQLQVQNPSTGQFQIIVVPDGVPPGGTLGVQM